jgi:hypothetical protein
MNKTTFHFSRYTTFSLCSGDTHVIEVSTMVPKTRIEYFRYCPSFETIENMEDVPMYSSGQVQCTGVRHVLSTYEQYLSLHMGNTSVLLDPLTRNFTVILIVQSMVKSMTFFHETRNVLGIFIVQHVGQI